MSNYKFLKYRHCWAWGYSKWKYKLIDSYYTEPVNEEEFECNIIDPIKEENNWSDKYRGIEYHVLDELPIDVLGDMAKCNHNLTKHYAKLDKFYDECIKKIKNN